MVDPKRFPVLAKALDQPILRDASVEFFPLQTNDQDDPYKIDEADVNLLLPDVTLEEAAALPKDQFGLKVQDSYEDPTRGVVTFWFNFLVTIRGQTPNPDGTVTLQYDAVLEDYEYGL